MDLQQPTWWCDELNPLTGSLVGDELWKRMEEIRVDAQRSQSKKVDQFYSEWSEQMATTKAER